MPRVIQVIQTDNELRGVGEPGDPYRRVTQYHTLDGDFLAESDPVDVLEYRYTAANVRIEELERELAELRAKG
jgi:hypothetical protein